MKIILDTDGTLTDFNKFIEENAIDYFKKKYNLEVVNKEALEIEEIFDLENFLMEHELLTRENAKKKKKQMLDEFWVSIRFVKFALFTDFRPGVKEIINEFIKQGHDVEVHTSRDRTSENSIVGKIAKRFTIYQYWKNGINLPENKFHFYKNDEEKIKGIISSKPDLVFEDKSEIINKLSENNIRTICVKGNHNKNIEATKNIEIITDFKEENLNDKLSNLFGDKEMRYLKREANSKKIYEQMRFLIPIAKKFFNPIVLNEQNILDNDDCGIIYAPNHMSTLDPLAIMSILDKNIHWAALLRFFEAKDSIFNNSKNPILCNITADVFKKLEYFPIDRKIDNPDANNFDAIKDMYNFLKINSKVGIFGEGTTRKKNGEDFNSFESSFLILAKKSNSWIQPITSLWLDDNDLIDSKVIINFGEPFKVGNMTIDDAMEHFMNIQKNCLEENKKLRNNLISENTTIKVKKHFKTR